jgi:putative ABC transport system permease protein
VDWKAKNTTFEALAAIDYTGFSLSSDGAAPEHVSGANVSGDFFSVFEGKPLLGRFLSPDDDHVGGPRVAVVSARLWHDRFASDPRLIGREVMLDSEAYTIVGVAPEGFRMSGPHSSGADLWTPLAVTRAAYARDLVEGRGDNFMNVVGRRKPGVTLAQAQADMTSVARALELGYPGNNTRQTVYLQDLHDALVGDARQTVWVLFAAVALVFSIVCSNVANLLLTRAQSRRAEMAARAALGATPLRLVRQVVTETVVLFLIGGLGGALAARGLVGLFASGIVARASGGARTIDIRVDLVALAFTIAACLCCGIFYGLIPALALARVEPQSVLQETATRASVGRAQRTVRAALVLAQVALACALLVGSGLALRAFGRVASTPPGFEPTDLATARINLPDRRYEDDDRTRAFYRDVLAKVAAQPGVTAVATNSSLPMGGSNWSSSMQIEGHADWPAGEEPDLVRNVVTPDYFRTMGIPVLRGRGIVDSDLHDGRPVVVFGASAAAHLFPGGDAIGHRISVDTTKDGKPLWVEIVGVVGDVRRDGLDQPIADEGYFPFAQLPVREGFIVARTSRPAALLHTLSSVVAEVDPQQAVHSRALMTELVADSVDSERQVSLLLASFAGAALILACLGVYGLVAYTTNQRRREIGIRMALGSTPAGAVGLVLRGGLRLLAGGLGLGMMAAVLVGRLLASRIEGVTAFDLSVYLAIPALLGLAGVVACLLPAWQAVRIPPASALRYE